MACKCIKKEEEKNKKVVNLELLEMFNSNLSSVIFKLMNF